MTFQSALYRGHLLHARRDQHATRRFRYPVFMAALDPDELPELHRRLCLFSYNRPGVFALHDRDYRDAGGRSLSTGIAGAHRAALSAASRPPAATTRLLTNLRTLGYVFNPVSFFLDYDADGALTDVTADVSNTYGGNHHYQLGPSQRDGAAGRHFTAFATERDFFVSPFLHGSAHYRFRFHTPPGGQSWDVRMDVVSEGSRVLFAHFSGERIPLTDRTLLHMALRFPLMSAQVVGLIHVEALRMHLGGVPYRRPGPDHRPHPAVPAAALGPTTVPAMERS